MTLVYFLAIIVSLAAYAFTGRVDMRLRFGLSLCIFIGIVAFTTWVLVGVGDRARPGSVDVPVSVSCAQFSAVMESGSLAGSNFCDLGNVRSGST